ncbi:hypothetical protein [Allokutzneria albata]|nr:hypothetical protein [Allokutzneria albata]
MRIPLGVRQCAPGQDLDALTARRERMIVVVITALTSFALFEGVREG